MSSICFLVYQWASICIHLGRLLQSFSLTWLLYIKCCCCCCCCCCCWSVLCCCCYCYFGYFSLCMCSFVFSLSRLSDIWQLFVIFARWLLLLSVSVSVAVSIFDSIYLCLCAVALLPNSRPLHQATPFAWPCFRFQFQFLWQVKFLWCLVSFVFFSFFFLWCVQHFRGS